MTQPSTIHTSDIEPYVPGSDKTIAFGGAYRIKSVGHGTVLDDWGGRVGMDSAALQPDDTPDSLHRTWSFVLQIKDPQVVISSFDFGDALAKLLEHGGVLDYALSERVTVRDASLQPSLEFSQSKTYSSRFSWGLSQSLGFEYAAKISCGFDFEAVSAGVEESFSISAEFGANQEWETSKTVTLSSSVSASPTQPGIYRIGRLVKQYENQRLPYTAKLTLSGKHPGSGLNYSGYILAAYLRTQGHNVVETTSESATTIIQGSLSADFAVSSTTIFEKIGDIAL